jgi:hypothetical protein
MADLTGRIAGAMKADVATLTEIENDPNAMGQALTVIVIAGIASLIGNIIRAGIGAGIFGLVSSIVGYLLFSLFVYLIGVKVMPEPATKADFNETFRVLGFAAAPGIFNVLAIIPILGVFISFVIWIWSLVIGVVAIREVLDYSNTGRAIIVAVIAWLVCMIVYFVVLTPIFLTLGLIRAITG